MHVVSRLTFALALALALGATAAAAPAPAKPAPIRLTWLGHAAFEIVSPGGVRLLIDPWLKENPKTPAEWKDFSRFARERPAYILLTHPHGDHGPDVPELARISGAKVVTTGEIARSMKIPEEQQETVNVGGSVTAGDVTIHPVPAMHSADPGGRPLGYVISFASGHAIYHSGDTWIFGDMALIDEVYHPDILLLATGGGPWGMDAKTAALAVRKYFHPRTIIPMHFGTFEPLASEEQVRAGLGNDKRVRFLQPGQTVEF